MDDNISSRLRASLDARETPALGADIVTGAAERPEPHMVPNRRRAVAAGGLTLAVAAVTVGALVVTLPGHQQQAPLFTTAGGGGSEAATMSADQRMMLWIDYEYLPGAGLSTSTGSGSVYQLQRSGTVEETLERAAEAYGVEGEVVESEYSSPDYPTYVVGPEDGTGPSVNGSWSGTGNWWYNNPAAYPQETPTTNAAPTEAEARTLAAELFAATGFEVDAADIRVTADEWQTTATANLVVDGIETALDWGVGWSTTGDISYAYGHSVTAVDKGTYDTVSEVAAIDRLEDWRWFGSPGPEYQSMVLYAADTLARGGEIATEELPAEELPTEVPGSDPTILPELPAEEVPLPETPAEETPAEEIPLPEPTPETVTVTLEEAHATLLLLWDSEGNAWLVPGFAYPTGEGAYTSVVSLIEGVISLPEPVEVEPYVDPAV